MTVKRIKHLDLSKILDDLKKKEIQVGFFETSHYPDGTQVAQVAAVNEFGMGVPARPFMRPAIAMNRAKWANQISSGVNAVIRGAIDLDSALEQVGMIGAGDVKDAIRAVTSPALDPITIRWRRTRKNQNRTQSVKPLIDTSLMLNSVQSAVKNK